MKIARTTVLGNTVIACRERPSHSAIFNRQVGGALLCDDTVVDRAETFQVHPNQVAGWKTQLFE